MNLVAALFVVSAVHAVPQLFCGYEEMMPQFCGIKNVHITQPRYRIFSWFPNAEIESVSIIDQQLAILSPDFCETFPHLLWIDAIRSGIEIIHQNALHSCYHLQIIDLRGNKIQILPPNLFRNNFKLHHVDLEGNRIGSISGDQFSRNTKLLNLDLQENRLKDFPLTAIKNCRKLYALTLHSNNLLELDVGGIVRQNRKLGFVSFNGNLFPCSKIRSMLDVLEGRNITLDRRFDEIERPYRMEIVEEFTCVSFQ